MNDMYGMWGFIGIIAFCCGIYAMYAYIQMKRTGEINASLLLGKEYVYKKCKNKEEYIRKAGPALLVLGIVAAVYGALDIVHCYVYHMDLIDNIGMGIFFLVLIWFAYYTTKLKRKYF